MALVMFTKEIKKSFPRPGRPQTCSAYISSNKYITFSAGCVKKFGLAANTYISLGYDSVDKKICIYIDVCDDDSHKMGAQSSNRLSCYIGTFVKYFDLSSSKSIAYDVNMSEEGLLVLTLKNRVFSKKPKVKGIN